MNSIRRGFCSSLLFAACICCAQVYTVTESSNLPAFLPPVTYAAGGPFTSSVAVADLNGTMGASQQPGKSHVAPAPPMAAAPRSSTSIDASPLIFLPAVDYDSGGDYVESIAVADLNGDGKPDVVVARFNSFSSSGGALLGVGVLLGNGDGTFQTAVMYGVGGSGSLGSQSVAVADVNGDGEADLLVANECAGIDCEGGGSVAVLLGYGDGTFRPAVVYASGGFFAYSLAVGDFNRDGKPDLLVANQCVDGTCYGSEGTVGVLLGNGDGTFQPTVTYNSGGGEPLSVAVADVNGDGKPDLLVGNQCTGFASCGSHAVGTLLGNGDGTFQPAITYAAGGIAVASIAVGDVNGDGKPDLLVADSCTLGCGSPSAVGVLLGNGDGTFQPAVTYDSGFASLSVAVEDVNGDGKPDLIVTDVYSAVGVLLGNGDGTFQPRVIYDSGGPLARSVVVADVNGDGKPDILVASLCSVVVNQYCSGDSELGVLLNNSGALPTTTSLASSANPVAVGRIVTYTATVAQSGKTLSGTVTFKDGSMSIATIALARNQASYSTSYSYKSAGSHSITASYSGVFRNAEGSRSAVLTEYAAVPSKTVLGTSGSPSLVGQPVTFTATVSSKSGTIPDGELLKFYDGYTLLGSVPLASEKAAFTTSKLSGGKTHGMRAIYVGDTRFPPSTGFVTQVVDLYSTTTALSSNSDPSTYGQTVTMTARVKSAGPYTPTGKVVFRNGTTWFGASAVNTSGVATLTRSNLNAGSYPLTAVYQSDANNAKSTSAVVQQVVKQTTSSATITSSPNPSTVGQAVTFTAKITSPTVIPTGPVTFKAGTTVLGTAQLSGGKAIFTTSTLPGGSTLVQVTYNGNSNIKGSSASVSQTLQP